MVARKIAGLLLSALVVPAVFPAFSQVVPAATEGHLPLRVGAGLSYYFTHLANGGTAGNYSAFKGNLMGPAAWVDWNFYRLPWFLNGLGVEVEGRHLNYARTGTDPLLREDTGEAGPIYTLRHFNNIHPYIKALAGFGSVDFYNGDPYYKHDTRTIYVPGAGVEYRMGHDLWLRGDYEYELWTHFGDGILKPQGFTIGVTYDFVHVHMPSGH